MAIQLWFRVVLVMEWKRLMINGKQSLHTYRTIINPDMALKEIMLDKMQKIEAKTGGVTIHQQK